MNWDTLIHLGVALPVLGVLWKANRVLNRFVDNLEDHPLHRHVGWRILYPSHIKANGKLDTTLPGGR
jgi:hypothetical protein